MQSVALISTKSYLSAVLPQAEKTILVVHGRGIIHKMGKPYKHDKRDANGSP